MRKFLLGIALVVLLTCLNLPAATAGNRSTLCPQFAPGTLCSSQQPYCGDSCDNTPFCPTTCWPTESGPAWAGGGDSNTYQLYCAEATYANCHYSGPPYPTGTNPENIPLPCKLSDDSKTANCKCQVFDGPNYVNLAAILNLGVYYETVEVCGSDGSKCQNASTCYPGSTTCEGQIPPVCQYVAQQNASVPETSLLPGADLISTYGFGMSENYPSGSTSCENSLVAGCMTAPCKYDSDNTEYAQCICPVSFQDAFELSQSGQQCDIGRDYAWE